MVHVQSGVANGGLTKVANDANAAVAKDEASPAPAGRKLQQYVRALQPHDPLPAPFISAHMQRHLWLALKATSCQRCML